MGSPRLPVWQDSTGVRQVQLFPILPGPQTHHTLASVTLHLGDPVQKKIMPPNQTFSRTAGTGTLINILTKYFKASLELAAVRFQTTQQMSMEFLSLCSVCSSQ